MSDLQMTFIGSDLRGLEKQKKFGYRPILTQTTSVIWDEASSVYNYIASTTNMVVSSDSATDATAGTGAQNIHIYGLDGSGLEIDEIITPAGTGTITSINEYSFVYRAHVETCGASLTNSGNVYVGTGLLTAGKPAIVHAKVTAGEGQTLMCVYRVPANKVAQMTDWYVNTGANKDVTVRLRTRESGKGFRTMNKVSMSQTDYEAKSVIPDKYGPLTDIYIDARHNSSGNVAVGAGFNMVLLDV